MTIILVDDDEDILKIYKKKITLSGFNILTAQNGKNAYKIIQKSKPDLIIIDLVMPVWDGFKLCKAIRIENKNIPIIAFTNLSSPHDKQEAINQGFVDYWIKSNYTPTEIVNKIKSILN